MDEIPPYVKPPGSVALVSFGDILGLSEGCHLRPQVTGSGICRRWFRRPLETVPRDLLARPQLFTYLQLQVYEIRLTNWPLRDLNKDLD